jgi:ribose 5-phosphate isomerase B
MEQRPRIYLGSDHAGFALRARIAQHLRDAGYEVQDLGAASAEPSDYPDYAAAVGRAVRDHLGTLGVLICGSGMGVCMSANKVRGIRAATPWNVETARLARVHNDVNVLCLGARFTAEPQAVAMVDAWLGASFEGGRHAGRLAKLAALEQQELREAAR